MEDSERLYELLLFLLPASYLVLLVEDQCRVLRAARAFTVTNDSQHLAVG